MTLATTGNLAHFDGASDVTNKVGVKIINSDVSLSVALVGLVKVANAASTGATVLYTDPNCDARTNVTKNIAFEKPSETNSKVPDSGHNHNKQERMETPKRKITLFWIPKLS